AIGYRTTCAACGRRGVITQKDRHFDAVVPVAFHLVNLHLQQTSRTDKCQRDEGNQYHGDDHGKVSANRRKRYRNDNRKPHYFSSDFLNRDCKWAVVSAG